MQFGDFELSAALTRAVGELGFKEPTPIQRQSIPPALEGRDVLACAMTGSGKTAAFVLPILERLSRRPRGRTRALVLTPTRELAAQIEEHTRALARHTGLRAAAIFGGVSMGPQTEAFRRGVDVLIATPGRLLDHMRNDYASLATIEHLVLDEADRMLDMGFLPDVRRILAAVPVRRQTLLFSATMPADIAALARDFMIDPLRVDVQRRAAPATGVRQAFYPVPRELKTELLAHLLDRHDIEQVLIFTRTKHRANRLAGQLEKRGLNVDRIHGNRSQAQRTRALAGFKNGSLRVLVATDIAARGIDVEALGHVINFDVPAMPDDYIHRVGRTARADLTGEAYTFVTPEDTPDAKRIERAIDRAIPRIQLDDFDYTARPSEALEIPLRDRIAAIRARKAEERMRAQARAETRAPRSAAPTARRERPSSSRTPSPAAAAPPPAPGFVSASSPTRVGAPTPAGATAAGVPMPAPATSPHRNGLGPRRGSAGRRR
jgi:ATP-dependent RNA helicase RhlE